MKRFDRAALKSLIVLLVCCSFTIAWTPHTQKRLAYDVALTRGVMAYPGVGLRQDPEAFGEAASGRESADDEALEKGTPGPQPAPEVMVAPGSAL